jgi:hypothetical protein
VYASKPELPALREMRRELDEARIEDLNSLRPQDKELVELTLLIADKDPASPFRGAFGDTYDISIEYADFQAYTEFDVAQKEADYLRTNGLITPLAYLNRFTEIDFGTIKELDDIYIRYNSDITTIDFSNLKSLHGSMNITDSTNLTSIIFGEYTGHIKPFISFQIDNTKINCNSKIITYLNLTIRFEIQITLIFSSKLMVCVCTSFHSHKQVRVRIPLKR